MGGTPINSPPRPESPKEDAERQGVAVTFLRKFVGAALEAWLGWPLPKALYEAAKERDKQLRHRRKIRAIITLSLLTLVSCGAAYLSIRSLLTSDSQSLIRQASILTFTAIVAIAGEIYLCLMKVITWVKKDTPSEMLAEYIKYFVTTLALSASIFAWFLSPQELSSQVPRELSRPTLLAQGAVRADYFPYLFDLADGPPRWRKGTQLNQQQLADIGKLANTLKACVGQLPNQDVVVEVVGFADANEFAHATVIGQSSVELNRQTANRRAAALADVLRTMLGSSSSPSSVKIARVIEWKSSDSSAMTRDPRYLNARPLTQTDGRDQGRFNRRAEIVLLRAGVCERYDAR
jgi:hypothetical protein